MDPTRYGRDLFDIWEKHTSRWWDTALRSPLLLEAMGDTLRRSLRLQEAARASADTWLRLAGLPTPAEHLHLQHRLNQLEADLQRLRRLTAEP